MADGSGLRPSLRSPRLGLNSTRPLTRVWQPSAEEDKLAFLIVWYGILPTNVKGTTPCH